MTNASTNGEVTAIDTQARGPLSLLLGSGLVWLLVSGILAVITSIQLHAPAFLADCPALTFGRAQALRETTFIYGWAANAGLGIALWVLGRLGGSPLRGLNWAVAGTVFWNMALFVGLIGIAIGDMTSVPFFQLPRYVLPVMLIAYGAIALPGVLAWSGRRLDGVYASQWYGVAALFLFPWLFTAAQIVILWSPLRGTLQAVAAGWYAQGVWTFWLAPLALGAAYYIVPKTAGRAMPSYDFASLGFWTLLFAGAWAGGRHLVNGPVPAWISTMAVACCSLMLFHYLMVGLNLRIACGSSGTAVRFIRFGLLAYILVGVLDAITSFRAIAVGWQFTFLATALEQLGLQGAISMIFFGAIYYMVPRLNGRPWASASFISGHRLLVSGGVVLLVLSLAAAGWTQGGELLDPKVAMADIFSHVRPALMLGTAAQLVLLAANMLILVNFCQSLCASRRSAPPAESPFQTPTVMEVHVS